MPAKHDPDFLKNLVNGSLENGEADASPPPGIDLSFPKENKPKKDTFSIHIDPEVSAALQKFAKKNDVSKSQVIEKLLRQVLPGLARKA